MIEEAFWRQFDAVCPYCTGCRCTTPGAETPRRVTRNPASGCQTMSLCRWIQQIQVVIFGLQIALSFRIGCRDSNVGKMVAFSTEILIKKFCIDIYFKI